MRDLFILRHVSLAISLIASMNELMGSASCHRIEEGWVCQHKSPKSLKNKATNYNSAVKRFHDQCLIRNFASLPEVRSRI